MASPEHAWGDGVTHFAVELDRESRVYMPGERVSGRVLLGTSAPLACAGLRVELRLRAQCHWHRGVRDDRTEFHGERLYGAEQRTVWGTTFKTATARDSGAHAVFGGPASPRAGDVDVPLAATARSFLALRVRDASWARADAALGETLLDVDALLAAGGAAVTLPLHRAHGLLAGGAYEPQLGDGGAPSVVVVSALPVAQPAAHEQQLPALRQGARRVCVRVHAALNLREGLLSGNDVFAELYEVPQQPPGTPLPPPPRKALLPAAPQLEVPFSFTLPPNCPSTLEHIPGSRGKSSATIDYAQVRASVFAYLDGAGDDATPAARALLTVVQPVSAGLPALAAPLAHSCELPLYGYSAAGALCCACLCPPESQQDTRQPLGSFGVRAALPRAGWAPGELLTGTLSVINRTDASTAVRAKLVRIIDFKSMHPVEERRTAEVDICSLFDQRVGPGVELEVALSAIVPLAAPDYHGGALEGTAAHLAAFLPPVAAAALEAPAEPVLWRTVLRVTCDMGDTVPVNPTAEVPLFICALPAPPEPRPQAMLAGGGGGGGGGGWSFTAAELAAAADLAVLSKAPPPTAAQQPPVEARSKADGGVHPSQLTYTPAYFFALPPAPRYALSPYATTRPPMDVSRLPPGAQAFCPYTEKPFLVAQYLIDAAPQSGDQGDVQELSVEEYEALLAAQEEEEEEERGEETRATTTAGG